MMIIGFLIILKNGVQVLIEANIVYENFQEWTVIKKIIRNSNNVNSFRY